MSNNSTYYQLVFCEKFTIQEGIAAIEEKVNELCDDGWQPQGGICVMQNDMGYYNFYQAMIRDF